MDQIAPERNYPITAPVVLAHLGCTSSRQVRRLTYRTDEKRLPAFSMFGRLMIGGQQLLDYVVRVRGSEPIVGGALSGDRQSRAYSPW